MKSKLEKISKEEKFRKKFNRLLAIREGIETGICTGAGAALVTYPLPIGYHGLITAFAGIGGAYLGYRASIRRNSY